MHILVIRTFQNYTTPIVQDICAAEFSGYGGVGIKADKDKARHSPSWGEPHLRATGRQVCHMGSHSVTCHPTQVNTPCLTPTMQAGTRFTYPGGMEGGVDLVDLTAPRPGVELATFRSRVRRPTTAPPSQPGSR